MCRGVSCRRPKPCLAPYCEPLFVHTLCFTSNVAHRGQDCCGQSVFRVGTVNFRTLHPCLREEFIVALSTLSQESSRTQIVSVVSVLRPITPKLIVEEGVGGRCLLEGALDSPSSQRSLC